jgi:hypothetical protein
MRKSITSGCFAVAIASIFAVDVARAQEPVEAPREPGGSFEERFEAGTALLEAGRKNRDRDSFERCASAFIELYNEFESSDRAHSLLFRAAYCSQSAGMIGQAIQLRTALLERHPQSRLAESTLWALAEGYNAITYYERAAERYEQYAEQYPKGKETPDALQNAYLFRVGLSQNGAALQDLDEYERLYAGEDPDEAARIFWARHDLLETQMQRRNHALEYLERHGEDGPLDRALVAEVVIARFDWRRSCAEPLLFDSCITIKRVGKRKWVRGISASDQAKVDRVRAEQAGKPLAPPKRCGGSGYMVVTVHARNQELERQAQDRLGRILSSFRKASRIEIPEHEVERKSDFADAWAMALVYQADAGYEEFLRLELPDNLDFFIDAGLRDSADQADARRYKVQVAQYQDSERRLSAFFERKRELGGDLSDRYSVGLTGSLHWQLVAATRQAIMHESFADQLDHAKISRTLRSEPQIAAYCDQLAKEAEPMRERAMLAWEYCVVRSTEFQYFNEFSRLCEARLADLDPWDDPVTNELFGESVYAPTRMRTVGVLPESGVPETR